MWAHNQVVIDVEQAGDRTPERRDHESDELDLPDIVAEHRHAARLFARAHQACAERRARQPPDTEQRDRKYDQCEIIETERGTNIDAERHRPGRERDTVIANGEIIGAFGEALFDL